MAADLRTHLKRKMQSLLESRGKTIVEVEHDVGTIYVTYTDGTFTLLAVAQPYPEESPYIDNPRLDMFDHLECLNWLRVCTVDEMQEYKQEQREIAANQKDVKDRAQYERLKKRYEK